MLDRLLQDVLQDELKRRAPPPPPKQVSFVVDVPKSHPGLPRLMAAARKMPDLELVNQDGVSVRRRQLITADVLEEFFDALRDVVGGDMADEIEEGLSIKGRIPELDPGQIRDTAQRLGSMMRPIFGLLGGIG